MENDEVREIWEVASLKKVKFLSYAKDDAN